VTAPERLVLAVDGGGTKTDVALIGVDGTLLARRIGPHAVPQVLGVTASLDVVLGLAAAACAQAGVGPASPRAGCLSSAMADARRMSTTRVAIWNMSG
jgi:N-acetylglucosamine kinase-like BadF-type ATPase